MDTAVDVSRIFDSAPWVAQKATQLEKLGASPAR